MAYGSSIDQRKTNKRNHIIDLFRRNGMLSKAMARSLSGYSMDTVIAIFNSLIKQKVILQADGRQKPKGRKAEFFTLNEKHTLYIGVTFNQSGIYSAAVSFSNRILDRRFSPLAVDAGRKEFKNTLVDHIGAAIKALGKEGRRIGAIGISVPGDIDPGSGMLRSYIFMPKLRDIDLKRILSRAFPGTSIYIDHNIRSMSLYVIHESEGLESLERVLLVSARSGVALGIIAGGVVITGHGELGHVRVSDENIRCDCGRMGCLDIYFSYRSFCRLCREQAVGREKAGSKSGAPRTGDLDILAAHYRTKKGIVYRELEKRLLYFTTALMDAANITFPDRIILTGEMLAVYGDPVREINRLAASSFTDTGYVSHFGRAEMFYLDLGTEIAAIGICFDMIRNEWGYTAEA